MGLANIKLFKIRGGVHPFENKHATSGSKIKPVPLADRLFIPLQQHIGAPAAPIVKRNEKVFKGQLLANSQGMISAPVHAPTSGKIIAIGKYPAPHPSGLSVRTIIIEPDGEERWADTSRPCQDPFILDPDEISTRVASAGIVGMGGATFPSAVKLNLRKRYDLNRLIINAAECEPYLTCDDQLMRENANDIIDGISIMMHALQIEKTIVAIEATKPEAIKTMEEASNLLSNISVVTVPVHYPMGSEKHLVQTLTGKETPAKALTADIGIVVHNVATAHAVQQCIRYNRPLIERVVTVSGGAVKIPGNYLTPIGTPVSQLFYFANGFTEEPSQIIGGGPMMGQPLPGTQVPIVKGSGGILALTKKETARKQTMPCIRCGNCVTACPCGLLPLEMASRARTNDFDGAVKFGLMDCISCGSCAYVCPSHIPLVQYFNFAKGALTEKQRAQHKQEEIKRLTKARSIRMEEQKKVKREMMAKRKAEIAIKKAQHEKEKSNVKARA
jgi:electron transport complex protein RnfC